MTQAAIDNTEEIQSSAGQEELSRTEIRRAMRIWNLEGCVATVQITLTMGAFQTGYAMYLHCSDVIIGILASIPSFAGLIQLVSSYFAERYGKRKQLVVIFALLSRLLWVPMLLIPFILPQTLWVGAFLCFTLLSSIFGNISAPLWTAWVSDLIPESTRGRYFGQRNMYCGIIGMITSIVGGAFIDMATKRHTMSQETAFASIFITASVFALLSFYFGSQSPDVPPKPNMGKQADASFTHAFAYYLTPFKDHNFRRLIAYFVTFNMAISIAGTFFNVYQISYLKLNYTAIQALGAVASLATLLVIPFWGYIADKYGNKPVLAISNAIVILPPLMWCFTYPDSMPGIWAWHDGDLIISYSKMIIIILNIIAGIGWAGVVLTQFNMMIASAPSETRTVYVSAISAVTGLSGAIGPLIGGAIIEGMSHFPFPSHGPIRVSYHIVFILSALFRGFAMIQLRWIAEAGSNSARFVLGQLKGANPLSSYANIKKLSNSNSIAARQQAAEKLAQLKTPVAVEELVKALDDVALPVREQAAVALGEIGDERAVNALIDKLADPAAGINEVAAEALGKIGGESAYLPLAEAAVSGPMQSRLSAIEALGTLQDENSYHLLAGLIDDDDETVRLSAIRAFAECDYKESAAILTERLKVENDPAIITVLADILGQLEDPIAIEALIAAMKKDLPPTGIKTIVNAIGSIVAGRDSLYPMLALDEFAKDEAVNRILTGIQRRMRSRAGQSRWLHHGRIIVKIRSAYEAYVADNHTMCLKLLTDAVLLDKDGSQSTDAGALLDHLNKWHMAVQTDVSEYEVLLAVVVVGKVLE